MQEEPGLVQWLPLFNYKEMKVKSFEESSPQGLEFEINEFIETHETPIKVVTLQYQTVKEGSYSIKHCCLLGYV